ncbi:hypothetical protein AAVH_25681 [Aphelenchoides avenae]|nr:hypothetical protein AAVH_25681 [Aphelenchus avenae]
MLAIFQPDSLIGRVWLGGPTAMVVGLVLWGKVLVDWGPAMHRGRDETMESLQADPVPHIFPNGLARRIPPKVTILSPEMDRLVYGHFDSASCSETSSVWHPQFPHYSPSMLTIDNSTAAPLSRPPSRAPTPSLRSVSPAQERRFSQATSSRYRASYGSIVDQDVHPQQLTSDVILGDRMIVNDKTFYV